MKKLNKPWLTQGLLKSIKSKQKMHNSHFLSQNPVKIKEYILNNIPIYQERIKLRERIPHKGPIPIVIPVKIFLDLP